MKIMVIMETIKMFFSDEHPNFEKNLEYNLYSSAYDVLRRRYVYIKNVIRDENNRLMVLAKTPGDTSYYKYRPNELTQYEF